MKKHYIEHDGKRQTIADWARELGISSGAIVRRLSLGWSDAEALSPLRIPNGRYLTGAYKSWRQMLRRCYESSHVAYGTHGARGITVCDRWRDSFENFRTDMGERPEGLSLDRINNDGNYEPSNCRWATSKTQARNKRSNRLLAHNGEIKTMAQWAEELGMPYARLVQRLKLYGWTIDRALTQPCVKGSAWLDLLPCTSVDLAEKLNKPRSLTTAMLISAKTRGLVRRTDTRVAHVKMQKGQRPFLWERVIERGEQFKIYG